MFEDLASPFNLNLQEHISAVTHIRKGGAIKISQKFCIFEESAGVGMGQKGLSVHKDVGLGVLSLSRSASRPRP
jgi:hypothetical protein